MDHDIYEYGTNDKANTNANIITEPDHKYIRSYDFTSTFNALTLVGTTQWKTHFLASKRFITNSYTITYIVLRKSEANNERRYH